MKFNYLIIVLMVCSIGLVSASSSVDDFFTNLESSQNHYYVLYEGSDANILENSKVLAQELGVDFSNISISGRNYIAVVTPPSLLGYLYWYENNFSYVQSIDSNQADVLLVYIRQFLAGEDSETEVNFIFEQLANRGIIWNSDFFVFGESSFEVSQGYSCEGFEDVPSSIQNSFEVDGVTFEDECIDTKNLLKMTCDDELSFEQVVCDGYCSEGACIAEGSFLSLVRSWVAGGNEGYLKRILNFFSLSTILF